jgi:hypothetical protein
MHGDPKQIFTLEITTMRCLLCCATLVAVTAVAWGQTADPAAQHADGYRQLAGSLDRCQDILSRISVLGKELHESETSPVADAVRKAIHDLTGQITALGSECAAIRPVFGRAREDLRRAAEALSEKAAQSDAAAASATEEDLKQQQLALSEQYGAAADAMSKVTKEWDTAAKKLEQCATFLAQSRTITLEWEKLTELMPLADVDERTQTVGQASTMARTVAARFSLLRNLKAGLPHLKAALSVLGYSVAAATEVPAPKPHETQLVRPTSSTRGTTPGPRFALDFTPEFAGARGLSSVEQLTRSGWLPGHANTGGAKNPLMVRPSLPGPAAQGAPPIVRADLNLLSWDRDYFAPNIGIHFRLVKVGGASGARLTRYPLPGSGAAQLLLEPGDTIYNLDALPIREAVDVMNHHGLTVVSFINIRNGQPQAGVMMLPGYTPQPADVPPERYAGNLGIHYQLMPYRDGSLGARLSRTAYGNTPAAALGLELGDMIVSLDGQPIHRPEDVLAHVDRTAVELIDIRTGRINTAIAQLRGLARR